METYFRIFTPMIRLNRSLGFLPLIFIILLSMFSTDIHAQSKSNKGKEFWLNFMAHIDGTDAGMSVYITSDSNTTGTVSVPGQSWSTSFSVTANSLTVVNVPVASAYIGCSNCISNKAVRVVSDDDVVVYAHHYEGNKSDATLVLPTRTLGKEYYAMARQESTSNFGQVGKSVFTVMAVKDSTVVRITPATTINGGGSSNRTAGTPFEITLDQGEVYQGIAQGTSDDVTGTHIEVIDTGVTANCRTVAVFSGSTYTRVGGCTSGFGVNSADNLFEQMFPTNSWGKRFVLVPALGRGSDNFRFMGSVDNTQLIIFRTTGSPQIEYVDEGEFIEVQNESTVRYAIATNPVLVAQFQKTAKCDGGGNNVGDPSMTILNPLEQTLKDITLYSSRFYDIDNHYINVVIPAAGASSFRIDGNAVTFSPVPRNAQYSYARLSVTAGNHRLTANQGFIATAYGEGQYESYGYAAGANVKDLTAVADVANSKKTDEISGCLGSDVEFAGSAEYAVVKWEWDFGDGNTDTVQNPTHTYQDTGLYTAKLYTYKPTFDGCSDYDSSFVDVRIYANPVAGISWGNICDSSTAYFYNESTVPDPEVYSFSRWVIDGKAPKFGQSVSQYCDTTGKFEVFMEVVTINQCRDTFVDSLIVNPKPEASFTVDDVCFFDSASFINTSTIASGTIDSFLWEFSDGLNLPSKDENPRYMFADSGSYSAALMVTSDSGCTDLIVGSMYKHPRFEVAFTYNDTCQGFGNLFENNTIIDGGELTDTIWYTSAMDTAYTYDYSKEFDAAGSYTVQLIMEQDSFCRDTFERVVEIHPNVIPNFTVDETCLGDSTVFTDISTLSTGTYTVTWDLDDGITGTSSPQKAKYVAGGVKDITLTTVSDNGCTSDTTKQIIITYPSITALNLSDGCFGTQQTISSTNSSGLDSFDFYQWTLNSSDISTDSSFNFIPAVLGFNNVILNVITKNGCTISLEDSFEVFDVPDANFFITSICADEKIEPTDNSSIDAPATIASYAWYLDDVLVDNTASPSFDAAGVGNSSIKLRVVSGDGCVDSTSKLVTVHPLPSAAFSIANTCANETAAITSNATIVSGSIVNTVWLIDGSSSAGMATTYPFPSAGDYTVEQYVESDKGCKDTLVQTITIDPVPSVSANITDTAGCLPFNVTIENLSSIASGNISTYTWDWGDGSRETADVTSHTYNNVGAYTISLRVESDKGCVDSITLSPQVQVHALPTADFTFSPIEPSTITEYVTLTDSSTSDVVMWDWSTSDGGTYSGEESFHTFADSGTYTVTLLVTNDNECTDEIRKNIYVNADLFVHIPGAFTPNGDYRNDTYGLGGLTQGVVDLQLQIFNRWGEMIFESTNVNERWDGTYKGKDVPQGVYIYVVKFTNPKRNKWYYYNGEIHLLR